MSNHNSGDSKIFFVQGNFAVVEGAISAGMRFFAGYPITPSSEILERLSYRLPQVGGYFLQMEDEIASIMATIGASFTGYKSMTATSGPGISLMSESIGFAIMTEAPLVLVHVMRGGPSTGAPTIGSQGDVMQVRWGTHGDHEYIALYPTSVQEMFDLTIEAFNLAEKYRTPVSLVSEELIAHMREKLVIPPQDEIKKRIINRKRPKVPPEKYFMYEVKENEYVPPMAFIGEGYHVHITGLSHDKSGFPSMNPGEYDALVRRLCDKIRKNKRDIIKYTEYFLDDSDIVVVAYGSPFRSSIHAVKEARKEGIKVGLLKLTTIWPFPEEVLREKLSDKKAIIVPELNYVQLGREVKSAVYPAPTQFFPRPNGALHKPEEILSIIKKVYRNGVES